MIDRRVGRPPTWPPKLSEQGMLARSENHLALVSGHHVGAGGPLMNLRVDIDHDWTGRTLEPDTPCASLELSVDADGLLVSFTAPLHGATPGGAAVLVRRRQPVGVRGARALRRRRRLRATPPRRRLPYAEIDVGARRPLARAQAARRRARVGGGPPLARLAYSCALDGARGRVVGQPARAARAVAYQRRAGRSRRSAYHGIPARTPADVSLAAHAVLLSARPASIRPPGCVRAAPARRPDRQLARCEFLAPSAPEARAGSDRARAAGVGAATVCCTTMPRGARRDDVTHFDRHASVLVDNADAWAPVARAGSACT